MPDLFPPWPMFSVFLTATLLLAVTPGPGVIYIVTRSFTQGRRSGLASVVGVALGNFGNAASASLGLAALFAASATAFAVVKYAGAVYLIGLGIQTLRAPGPGVARAMPEPAGLWRIVRDGFFVALLNPKTTMFFAAFLPQFMSKDSVSVLQSVTLGSIFVAIATVTDAGYALAAGTIAPMLSKTRGLRSLGRYVTGGGFIGLGVYTALSGSRSGR